MTCQSHTIKKQQLGIGLYYPSLALVLLTLKYKILSIIKSINKTLFRFKDQNILHLSSLVNIRKESGSTGIQGTGPCLSSEQISYVLQVTHFNFVCLSLSLCVSRRLDKMHIKSSSSYSMLASIRLHHGLFCLVSDSATKFLLYSLGTAIFTSTSVTSLIVLIGLLTLVT